MNKGGPGFATLLEILREGPPKSERKTSPLHSSARLLELENPGNLHLPARQEDSHSVNARLTASAGHRTGAPEYASLVQVLREGPPSTKSHKSVSLSRNGAEPRTHPGDLPRTQSSEVPHTQSGDTGRVSDMESSLQLPDVVLPLPMRDQERQSGSLTPPPVIRRVEVTGFQYPPGTVDKSVSAKSSVRALDAESTVILEEPSRSVGPALGLPDRVEPRETKQSGVEPRETKQSGADRRRPNMVQRVRNRKRRGSGTHVQMVNGTEVLKSSPMQPMGVPNAMSERRQPAGPGGGDAPSDTRDPGQRIQLNVGGRLFVTTLGTLTRTPSMLQSMFSGVYSLSPDCHANNAPPTPEANPDAFFIDRDPHYFGLILNYLRDGVVFIEDMALSERARLLHEARFYQVQSLVELLSADAKREKARKRSELSNEKEYRLVTCNLSELKETIFDMTMGNGWDFENWLQDGQTVNILFSRKLSQGELMLLDRLCH